MQHKKKKLLNKTPISSHIIMRTEYFIKNSLIRSEWRSPHISSSKLKKDDSKKCHFMSETKTSSLHICASLPLNCPYILHFCIIFPSQWKLKTLQIRPRPTRNRTLQRLNRVQNRLQWLFSKFWCRERWEWLNWGKAKVRNKSDGRNSKEIN